MGIAMMLAGVASLSANDALAKTLVADYPPLQILFLRNIIALPFAILLTLRMGGPAALRSYRPAAHLVRGVLWISAGGILDLGGGTPLDLGGSLLNFGEGTWEGRSFLPAFKHYCFAEKTDRCKNCLWVPCREPASDSESSDNGDGD